MKSNDLKRALQCLLTMSNSRDIGQDNPGLDLNDILNLTAKKENLVEAVQGIVKFAKEFLDLIDAADATAQADIAREALKRLATAGSVKGALQGHELRGLALRLANHGELTRLSVCCLMLISSLSKCYWNCCWLLEHIKNFMLHKYLTPITLLYYLKLSIASVQFSSHMSSPS